MPQLFLNNFRASLASELTSGALSMTLDDATGFPTSIGAGDFILLTLDDGPVETAWEIVRIEVGRTGNVIPIDSRGQEGTGDVTWPAGSRVSARVTAATMDDAIALGAGGGGGDTPRETGAMTDAFDNSGVMFSSVDGGASFIGNRGFIGLSGGDIDTPRFVDGTGVGGSSGIALKGSEFV